MSQAPATVPDIFRRAQSLLRENPEAPLKELRARIFTRPDLPEGCPEKLDFEFLEWVLTFPENGRQRIISKLGRRPREQRLIVLRSPREVANFLQDAERADRLEREHA